MHIYKREDGAFVIDFEGDLLVSDKASIRFSDFKEQEVVFAHATIAINNENCGSRFARAVWAIRQCIKRL